MTGYRFVGFKKITTKKGCCGRLNLNQLETPRFVHTDVSKGFLASEILEVREDICIGLKTHDNFLNFVISQHSGNCRSLLFVLPVKLCFEYLIPHHIIPPFYSENMD